MNEKKCSPNFSFFSTCIGDSCEVVMAHFCFVTVSGNKAGKHHTLSIYRMPTNTAKCTKSLVIKDLLSQYFPLRTTWILGKTLYKKKYKLDLGH